MLTKKYVPWPWWSVRGDSAAPTGATSAGAAEMLKARSKNVVTVIMKDMRLKDMRRQDMLGRAGCRD